MTSEVWVWAWLAGDIEPTLAGRFIHEATPTGFRGNFVYGKSYLANTDAIALDPLQLKLAPVIYETASLQGFFGPLRDAMPDDWGRYVIDRQMGPQTDLCGYLLNSKGDHIGNLGFSASKDTPPAQPRLPGLDIVEPARSVIKGLEDGRPLDPEVVAVVRPNTALGGARPKLTIQADGRQWIAKFPAANDRGAPIARLEAAMLQLASDCGIRAATAKVVHDDVLLVERFDRAWVSRSDQAGWRRDAFLSAQTVFHTNPSVQAYSFSGSYPRLALDMVKFTEEPSSDRVELFRRMVFNCCISNTDDHERNHGFIASDTPGAYMLSPAYDMVPRRHGTARREHALSIGDEGFVPTRSNILSGAAAFGLGDGQAREILDEVQARVSEGWRSALSEQGVTEDQAAEWSLCFRPLPGHATQSAEEPSEVARPPRG